MKFLTRITSVLLVVLISAAALAGCGKEGQPKLPTLSQTKTATITLLIGGIGALTGDYAVYGEAVRNDAQLAVDESTRQAV